jgi:hypothetical protein
MQYILLPLVYFGYYCIITIIIHFSSSGEKKRGQTVWGNTIIMLYSREYYRELWGCIKSFIIEKSGWKTVSSLSG